MAYGQLPSVIQRLPARLVEEMKAAVLDYRDYQREMLKPDEEVMLDGG